mgnify:CR=1 FL=1
MSGSLDLSSYGAIKQAAFVRMVIPNYDIIRFSSHDVPVNITESDNVSYTYTPMGILLGISEFNNELTPSGSDVTISMSAIEQTFVASMMDYKLKGSSVTIYRVFFDAASNPREMLHPDFKVATKKWVVETNPKWRLGDSDTVTYE